METVKLPKSVRSGVATDSGRYAINSLLLKPGTTEGTVNAISTDGHQLTVVELEGSLTETFLLPADALPTTKSGVTATFQGQNGTRTVSTRLTKSRKPVVTDVEESPGTFPRLEEVIPEAAQGAVVVCINAELLLKAARAMVTDPDAPPVVTLLIDAGRDEQNRGFPIMGTDGFGVLMPCQSDFDAARFNARREAFLAE